MRIVLLPSAYRYDEAASVVPVGGYSIGQKGEIAPGPGPLGGRAGELPCLREPFAMSAACRARASPQVSRQKELQKMSWLVFAFSGPVLWAISTHLDKYLVERYFKEGNVAVLLVFTAFIGLLLLPFIAAFRPGLGSAGPQGIAVITASGVLYMTAMFFYLQALQREEASIVAPFYQAAPLFAYALGYVFLGESLTGRQILGGALIVVGGFILARGR